MCLPAYIGLFIIALIAPPTHTLKQYVNHQSAIFNIATPATSDTFMGFTVVIQSGMQSGDQLNLSPISGWVITWTAAQWMLTVVAPSTQSAASITSVLNQVTLYITTYSTTPRTISYTYNPGSGTMIYFSSNQHFYESVPVTTDWNTAKTLCAARTLQGKSGYLATITSLAEYNYFNQIATGNGWLGGSDAASEGVWKWVTGPEAGTTFFIGNYISGTCQTFCQWSTNQPDNAGNLEHYMQAVAGGQWNDLPVNYGGCTVYYCEYGGQVSDPVPGYSMSGVVTVTYSPAIMRPNKDLWYYPFDQITVPNTNLLMVGFTMTIETNFFSGYDELRFGPNACCTYTFDSSIGLLTVTTTGSVSSATASSYVQLVRFYTTHPSKVKRRISFSFKVGGSNTVFYSANGHFYENVPAPGLSWTSAKNACAGRTIQGKAGYLATLTSAAEYAYFNQIVSGLGWLGGSDAASEGTWIWATGPEAGQVFTLGATCQTWCNWAAGEPNNAGGENCLHALANGQWNDFADGNPSCVAYFCEYGGLATDANPPPYTMTGTIEVYYNPTKTRSISYEEATNEYTMTLSQSLSHTDTFSLERSKTKSNTDEQTFSLTFTDSHSQSMTDSITDDVSETKSSTDDDTLSLSLTFTNSITFDHSATKTVSREGTFSSSHTATDSITDDYSASRTLSEDDTLSGTLTMSDSHSFTDSLTDDYSKSRTISDEDTLSSTLTLTDSLSEERTFSRTYSDSLTFSFSLSFTDSITGEQTGSGTVTESEERTRSGTFTDTFTSDQTLSGTLSPEHSPTFSVTRDKSKSLTLTFSLSLTFSTSREIELTTQTHSGTQGITDSMTLTNTVTAEATFSDTEAPSWWEFTLSMSQSQTDTLSRTSEHTQSSTESQRTNPTSTLTFEETNVFTQSLTLSASRTLFVSSTKTQTFLEIFGPTLIDGTALSMPSSFEQLNVAATPIIMRLLGDTWSDDAIKGIVNTFNVTVACQGSSFKDSQKEVASTSVVTRSADGYELSIQLGYDTKYRADCLEKVTWGRLAPLTTKHVEPLLLTSSADGFQVSQPLLISSAAEEQLSALKMTSLSAFLVSAFGGAAVQTMYMVGSHSCMSVATRRAMLTPYTDWVMCPMCKAIGETVTDEMTALYNSISVLGFVSLHAVLVVVLKIFKFTWEEARSMVMFPSLSISFSIVLLQSTTASSVRVLDTGVGNAGYGVLGLLVAPIGLFCVIGILLHFVISTNFTPSPDLEKKSFLFRMLFYVGVWLPRNDAYMYSALLDVRPGMKYFNLMVIAYYILLGGLTAVHPSVDSCTAMNATLASIFLAMALALIIIRPLRSTVMSVLRGVCLLAQSLLPLSNLITKRSDPWVVDAALSMILMQYCAVVIDTLTFVTCTIHEYYAIRTIESKQYELVSAEVELQHIEREKKKKKLRDNFVLYDDGSGQNVHKKPDGDTKFHWIAPNTEKLGNEFERKYNPMMENLLDAVVDEEGDMSDVLRTFNFEDVSNSARSAPKLRRVDDDDTTVGTLVGAMPQPGYHTNPLEKRQLASYDWL